MSLLLAGSCLLVLGWIGPGLLIVWGFAWRRRAIEAEAALKRPRAVRGKTMPPSQDDTVPSSVQRKSTPLEPWTPPRRGDDDN